MPESRRFFVISDEQNTLIDITVMKEGKRFSMLGVTGKEREKSFAKTYLKSLKKNSLPVLLGAGCGVAIDTLIEGLTALHGDNWTLAVVDKEEDILAGIALKEKYKMYPGIFWVTETDSSNAIKALTSWQEQHGNLPFSPCSNSFYFRLDKEYYSSVREICLASAKVNFWKKTEYPRFQGTPRILLLTSRYFLIGELVAACDRLGVPYHLLQIPNQEMGQEDFIQSLLKAVIDFRPDFAITLNHLGVDREGTLIHLFEKLRLPLASWFVDNPLLILSLYEKLVSPWTTIFTWDADNLSLVKELGFEHVEYLPLGTDNIRFSLPSKNYTFPTEWKSDVSFVGNSMVHKCISRKNKLTLTPLLLETVDTVSEIFAESEDRSVGSLLRRKFPDLAQEIEQLPSNEERLGYDALVTWKATLQYRFSCITATFPFNPLIAGDDGWKTLIPDNVKWRYISELNYYSDLPLFYPASAINFNCTSKQMKGAVNQRVFDVPATGSFLITDYREQVENLFEPGKEIVCYNSPEEAEEIIKYFLKFPQKRQSIATAARKRILAEHTYDHRISTILEKMKAIYG